MLSIGKLQVHTLAAAVLATCLYSATSVVDFAHAQSKIQNAKHSTVAVYDIIGPWRVLAIRSKRHQMRPTCSGYYKFDERLGQLFVATISKDWNGRWKVGFRNETWPIQSRSVVTGTLIDLDSKTTISGTEPSYRDKSITFPIGATPEDVQKLKKQDRLRIELKSTYLNARLNLPRTAAVIERIQSCIEDIAE